MKMKKELYLAIILLILIPSESVFAQVNLSDIAEEGGLISKKDEKRSALDKDEALCSSLILPSHVQFLSILVHMSQK